ncbi:hypothetical protein ACFQOZ_12895 [Comamonas endophytica]
MIDLSFGQGGTGLGYVVGGEGQEQLLSQGEAQGAEEARVAKYHRPEY